MQVWKRVLTGTLSCLLLGLNVLCCIWAEELLTLSSVKQIRAADAEHRDGVVYSMRVSGGFYLEEYIQRGGVQNDEELVKFVADKLTHGLLDIDIRVPELGCATFTATDVSGDALYARNYDIYETAVCVVTTERSGERHATISTADLGFVGIDAQRGVQGLAEKALCLAAPYIPVDGMNDAGVSCCVNVSYQGYPRTVPTQQDTEAPDLTPTMLLRLILDYADDVDEAVAIARAYDMHDSIGQSFQYVVADASGRSAVMYWSGSEHYRTDNDGTARKLHVIYDDDDAAVGAHEASCDEQVATNFLLQPGYYEGAGVWDVHGADRYERIWKELDARGGTVENEQDALAILRAVGARDWYRSTPCTVHSVVYNLTDGTVAWVSNENFDEPDAQFAFAFS